MSLICTTEKFSLAPNHNNTQGLRSFNILSPPLFEDYFYVNVQFRPFETTVQKGNNRKGLVGLPYCWVEFEILRRSELFHLINNYTDNGLDGEVTIYAPDTIEDEWYYWNARIDFQENLESLGDNVRGPEWLDVKIYFYEMEKIL